MATIVLALLALIAAPPEVGAQSYISPLVGYDFGGDSVCPQLTGCEEKQLQLGVGLGHLGAVFGYETDFGYTKDFFGNAPGLTTSLLTVMGNVLLVPAVGPVRPYALAGLGLIRTKVDVASGALATNTANNDLGWDVGGGVFVFLGEHVGIRGDIRYFHSFEELRVAGFRLGDSDLDFGRASAALVLKF